MVHVQMHSFRAAIDGLDNLFAASIVAVRGATGEYVWHYQPVPGDSWDYDPAYFRLLLERDLGGAAGIPGQPLRSNVDPAATSN